MSLVHAGENVMVFRTFAKAHGLAALPFGYAIAPRALARVPQFKKPLRSMADTYAI
jgi:histidinol-phosphate/aromatic aminotransferase/cobyric acid decarboxylase-like protein